MGGRQAARQRGLERGALIVDEPPMLMMHNAAMRAAEQAHGSWWQLSRLTSCWRSAPHAILPQDALPVESARGAAPGAAVGARGRLAQRPGGTGQIGLRSLSG